MWLARCWPYAEREKVCVYRGATHEPLGFYLGIFKLPIPWNFSKFFD
jgi:hypothetical protein